MKHIRKDGSAVEGSPEEIAKYHKLMAGGNRRKARATGVRRARYSTKENAAIRKMVREGKTYLQISAKLWKLGLSPHKRTEQGIIVQVGRLSK